MKDFDIIRAENREHGDREFTLLGREFRFKPYLPAGVFDELTDELTNADWEAAFHRIMAADVLEPGQTITWSEVRDEKERPLSIYELVLVLNHVREVTSGRPTEPSSDSTLSPLRRGTSSTENSPSPAAAT